ncbi:MAG: FAD-binding oxidoreductase [Chloroflexota bacterium]
MQGSDIVIATTRVDELSKTFQGKIIQPGDPDYDDARSLWNGMIDKKPALIAQCASDEDVAAAIKFARENDIPLSVKGGGHGVAGKAIVDDGIVIDLSAMNAVHVDPVAKRARVQGGAKLGDVDRETQAHGLVTTAGIVSTTGVAGLTLGGGLGYLARKFGLAADNLISAHVVTADGKRIHASEDEHSDLLWALRGGGANFGVVTQFEFQLHELGPEVMTAQAFHPFKDAKDLLRYYRDFLADAPDELGLYFLVLNVPPMDPFPEEWHGEPAVLLLGCYAGPVEEGREVLAPLETHGNPILSVVAPMPYTALQSNFDAGFPEGPRYYWKSHIVRELTDEAIDTFIEKSLPLDGGYSATGIESMGGAISRVDPRATAFPHRDGRFACSAFAGWTDPADDEKLIAWARDFYDAMKPHGTGGVYVNYQAPEEDVGPAYRSNYERLQQVKARYDPDNLFRSNQNITPVSTGAD